jgi:hypothetical protein
MLKHHNKVQQCCTSKSGAKSKVFTPRSYLSTPYLGVASRFGVDPTFLMPVLHVPYAGPSHSFLISTTVISLTPRTGGGNTPPPHKLVGRIKILGGIKISGTTCLPKNKIRLLSVFFSKRGRSTKKSLPI